MPLAQSSNRYSHIMTIYHGRPLFFHNKKGASPVYFLSVNVGISTTLMLLAILRRNTTIDTILDKEAHDDCVHLWQCPVSPRTASVAGPVVLYGAKTVPPTKAERRQETMLRQQHCTAGTGPNHRRLQRRHLRHNPRPVTQQWSLFYTPHRRRQLSDWVFPSTKRLSPRAIRATNDKFPPQHRITTNPL